MAGKVKQLAGERRKRLVADLSLDKHMLQDVLSRALPSRLKDQEF